MPVQRSASDDPAEPEKRYRGTDHDIQCERLVIFVLRWLVRAADQVDVETEMTHGQDEDEDPEACRERTVVSRSDQPSQDQQVHKTQRDSASLPYRKLSTPAEDSAGEIHPQRPLWRLPASATRIAFARPSSASISARRKSWCSS